MQELSNVVAKKYDEVVDKIKIFSDEYLNEAYKGVCLDAAEVLFSINEEGIKKGKSISWAAGIVHAIGSVNGLFDAKKQPYMKATDLYRVFEISSSTVNSKSKEIKTLLDISDSNKKWLIDFNNDMKEVAATKENSENFRLRVDKAYVISQKVMNDAWKLKDYTTKYKMAIQAISIYKDCADAYIILSLNSKLPMDDKIKYLKRAVKAAENVLKIDTLESADARLFAMEPAEPLFGAKYLLAKKLWQVGKKEEAIENALEIVTYDKRDKSLARGLVSNWLLLENRNDEAKTFLMNLNNDIIASINFDRAAMLFRCGEKEEAEKALERAMERNPFVLGYLIGKKEIPEKLPKINAVGGENEAVNYAKSAMKIWEDTDVQNWLKKFDHK